jgi:hypothetical protein
MHKSIRPGCVALTALLLPVASWAQGLPGLGDGSVEWHH